MVATYHCDVTLPPGLVNDVQRVVVDASNRVAMRRSMAVAVTSEDYARHSRMWPSIEPSMHVVPPPCPAAADRPAELPRDRRPHIGFLGRIVREKGLEHLVRAFRALPDPDARLLIGGDYIERGGRQRHLAGARRDGTTHASGCSGSCPRSGSPTSTPRSTCSRCRR